MTEPETVSHAAGNASALDRLAENFAKSKFGGWFAIQVANPVDRRLIKATGNKLSLFRMLSPRIPVGLLTVTGAKSGRERRTPLLYAPVEDKVVLVASKAGAAKNPAWYHNLKANPEVTFLGRDGERPYTAREAVGKEREKLWTAVNDVYDGYDTYQERAGSRRIPIMVLEPRD